MYYFLLHMPEVSCDGHPSLTAKQNIKTTTESYWHQSRSCPAQPGWELSGASSSEVQTETLTVPPRETLSYCSETWCWTISFPCRDWTDHLHTRQVSLRPKWKCCLGWTSTFSSSDSLHLSWFFLVLRMVWLNQSLLPLNQDNPFSAVSMMQLTWAEV